MKDVKKELIDRDDAIEALYKEWLCCSYDGDGYHIASECERVLDELPSTTCNITMKDVIKYIDKMPEDVWQEFTSCLECRGWNLERVGVAKWCGSEFA